MGGPSPQPAELERDDSPLAAAEGNLSSVTDDEYFDAVDKVPAARTDSGEPVNTWEGVHDLRHLSPERRDAARAQLAEDR